MVLYRIESSYYHNSRCYAAYQENDEYPIYSFDLFLKNQFPLLIHSAEYNSLGIDIQFYSKLHQELFNIGFE